MNPLISPSNKEDIIKRFENACDDPSNITIRKFAVGSQFMRNLWEIPDQDGLIRIHFENRQNSNEGTIEVFNTIEYVKMHGKQYAHQLFLITVDEYYLLKKKYFGSFVANKQYLKMMGVTEE